MRIVLFGTGKLYERYRNLFEIHQIVVLLDNDVKKQGCYVDGFLVDSPANISKYVYDYIFILAKDYYEIRNQLIEYGVTENKICDISDRKGFNFLSIVKSYVVNKRDSGKRILMLTHTLDYTGAPLVLFNAAKILADNGYQIHLACFKDGILKRLFIDAGVSVSVINCLHPEACHLLTFFQWSDIVFFNTLEFYSIIKGLNSIIDKRVIWWLHEEENYYNDYNIMTEDDDSLIRTEIYGVGKRVIKAFRNHFRNKEINELLYGINEVVDKRNISHEGIVFAFIGSCDYRKGEDVFFGAIEIMNREYSNIIYWIIGDTSETIRSNYSDRSNIVFWGILDPDEMIEKYSEIDVLVCPSRNDPMPVVVTEAMMMKKTCIVSDNTGQADMIKNGFSGLICRSGDTEDLFSKMKWVVENKGKLHEIGENAYRIYTDYFSMVGFKEKLIQVIEGKNDEV